MASNFKETAVKTVRVSVKRLQETLSKNLEIHRQEFKEAWEGFESARIEAMRNLAKAAASSAENWTPDGRKAVHDAYNYFRGLTRPQDHSKSYEQAIALMEWEQREEIDLSINDFECYVRDNWDWSGQFKSAHAHYNAHSHSL